MFVRGAQTGKCPMPEDDKRDRCENRFTSKQKGFMDRAREMLQAAMVGTDMRDDPEYKKGVK